MNSLLSECKYVCLQRECLHYAGTLHCLCVRNCKFPSALDFGFCFSSSFFSALFVLSLTVCLPGPGSLLPRVNIQYLLHLSPPLLIAPFSSCSRFPPVGRTVAEGSKKGVLTLLDYGPHLQLLDYICFHDAPQLRVSVVMQKWDWTPLTFRER